MSEYTGKDVSYYLVPIPHPKRLDPYTAECEDIIEALGMTFAEGCAFKAIWRKCAARTLGLAKAGYKGGLYDAEKAQYYGARMVVQETRLGSTPDQQTIADSATREENARMVRAYADMAEDALRLIDNCAVCGIDQNGDPDLHYVGCPNLTATPAFQAEVDATMGEVFGEPDMSDWRNWRVGDKVVVTEPFDEAEEGEVRSITQREGGDYSGDLPLCIGGIDWPYRYQVEWHSRPAK